MNVSIDSDPDSGDYYIRQFDGPLVPDSFQAPDDRFDAFEVPDHVVAAYCALRVQEATMQTLLGMLLDQHEAQHPPPPPPSLDAVLEELRAEVNAGMKQLVEDMIRRLEKREASPSTPFTGTDRQD